MIKKKVLAIVALTSGEFVSTIYYYYYYYYYCYHYHIIYYSRNTKGVGEGGAFA